MARNIALSVYVTSFVMLVGCVSYSEAAMGAVSPGGLRDALVGELEAGD
jgi:hypothetical protein